ncbi:reverse transcriptase family protein [Weeksellaceae bacterium TAE3-ERU29]|nr:reverse transcriptase family protein [Weeksellaceae bacterium TAE3-ERU29]
MKIEQQHIDFVKEEFAKIQTKEDLLCLLNNAKKIIYKGKCTPISLRQLTYFANPNFCKERYRSFTIKKKSGADRLIHAPEKGLKSILRPLNFILQCIDDPHKSATGFVLDKSIVDNAKKHIDKPYVYNIDIKDFFHSFTKSWVKYGFMTAPFNLGKEKEDLAFLLASLCTHPFEIDGKIQNVLPQGSPTSPTITNILCKRLDRRLSGLAKRFGATYTRYADDITFSAMYNIFKEEENPQLNEKGRYDNFIAELERLITQENLIIKEEKVRLQNKDARQEVTGLVVNDKVNVRRRYVKQLRMWLYYWEKYGYNKASEIFSRDYKADKGHVKKGTPNFANVLDGKLQFLKMVKGEQDATYKKLKERFDVLKAEIDPINEVLDIWEEEGIEKAMDFYSKRKKTQPKKKKNPVVRTMTMEKLMALFGK